ncbi:hypothetical protein ACFX2I_043718 [Malus domestica]
MTHEGVANEKLRALLGLYVLQIIYIVSMNHNVTISQLFVLQLSSFFPFCGLSYLGVITGSDVDKRAREVVGEDEDMSCLSDVKCGAPLSVKWGHASDDVVWAAEKDLTSLLAALQAVQMVIIYASDTTLRKTAFEAFKRILVNIPASQRFGMLKSLIINSNSSSMVKPLEPVYVICIPIVVELYLTQYYRMWMLQPYFWTASVLELVELILKPPEGGPPSFPEDTDKICIDYIIDR